MANIDIGSLKLQFNNDILKIKKYILQAKTQTIHKLTRNVQKLKKRKGTEEELQKFNSKADSLVKEIMFIKKINPNDLGRFAMKNFDNLSKIMDTPIPTEEKAMAKIVSHKCLNSRFKEISLQFSIVPLDTLLQVNGKKLRRKEKKAKAKVIAKSSQDNESKKNDPKEIEDFTPESNEDSSQNESYVDKNNSEESDDNTEEVVHESVSEADDVEDSDINDETIIKEKEFSDMTNLHISESDDESNSEQSEDESEDEEETPIPIKSSKRTKDSNKINIETRTDNPNKEINTPQSETKAAKFKKPKRMFADLEDNEVESIKTEKTVDSFFMTDSGDNYLTVSLPRKPDPKPFPEDSTSNRKMRRATMFGNEVKPKRVNKQNRSFENKSDDRFRKSDDNNKQHVVDRRTPYDDSGSVKREFHSKNKSMENEKLHPSWEAKKKKSSLVAFEGKKVVFGD